jgi:hypothetical protein
MGSIIDAPIVECWSSAARLVHEPRVEQRGFVVGQVTGGPQHTVFRVQLGRQCPAPQAAVHAVFVQPCGEFTLSVEVVAVPAVAHDVVDRTQPVVRAADRSIEQRVAAITVERARRHFEHPMHTHGFGELRGGGVRRTLEGGNDPDRARDLGEPTVHLCLEVGVRGMNNGIARDARRGQERLRDAARVFDVKSAEHDYALGETSVAVESSASSCGVTSRRMGGTSTNSSTSAPIGRRSSLGKYIVMA